MWWLILVLAASTMPTGNSLTLKPRTSVISKDKANNESAVIHRGCGRPDSCVHGICRSTSNGSYECFCENGYTGNRCQTDYDDCAHSLCHNEATCVDQVARFICVCVDGFTGSLCESAISHCTSQPCLNGGKCEDLDDGYSCLCHSGFKGLNCEIDIDVCNSSNGQLEAQCLNGGTCFEGVGISFTCSCLSGFEGPRCETDVDECLSQPCFNNGTCVDELNGFRCICAYRWRGTLCDEEQSLCSPLLCSDRGVCLGNETQFTCYCVPDYHGLKCQWQYDECLPEPKCLNGGTCVDGVDSYSCLCLPRFQGQRCEVQCATTTSNIQDTDDLPLPGTNKSHPAITNSNLLATPFPYTGLSAGSVGGDCLSSELCDSRKEDYSVAMPDRRSPLVFTNTLFLNTFSQLTFTEWSFAENSHLTTSLSGEEEEEEEEVNSSVEFPIGRNFPKMSTSMSLMHNTNLWQVTGVIFEISSSSPTFNASQLEISSSAIHHLLSSNSLLTENVFFPRSLSTDTWQSSSTILIESSRTISQTIEWISSHVTYAPENDSVIDDMPHYSSRLLSTDPVCVTASNCMDIGNESSTAVQFPEVSLDFSFSASSSAVLSSVEETFDVTEFNTLEASLHLMPTTTTFSHLTPISKLVVQSGSGTAIKSSLDKESAHFPSPSEGTKTLRPIRSSLAPSTHVPLVVSSTQPPSHSSSFPWPAISRQMSPPAHNDPVTDTCGGITCQNGGTCHAFDVSKDHKTYLCLCPLYFTGTFCQDFLPKIDIPSFSGHSWLVYNVSCEQGIRLYLQFKTIIETGLLFFLNVSKEVGSIETFLLMQIANGLPVLSFSCGVQSTVSIEEGIRVDDGQPHAVLVGIEWSRQNGVCNVSMQVDNWQPIMAQQHDTKPSRCSRGYLHVGGGRGAERIIPHLTLPLIFEGIGFRGCITELQINDKLLSMARDATEGGAIRSCEGFCSTFTCYHGGRCQAKGVNGHDAKCLCSDPTFVGRFCEQIRFANCTQDETGGTNYLETRTTEDNN